MNRQDSSRVCVVIQWPGAHGGYWDLSQGAMMSSIPRLFVAIIVATALISCTRSNAPDCTNSDVLGLVESLFVRPKLELAYFVQDGRNYAQEDWNLRENVINPLLSFGELTEEQRKTLDDANTAIRLASMADISFVGIRRVDRDDIALSCSCVADLHIAGVQAIPNITYTGQFSLDSMVYASVDGVTASLLMEHFKKQDKEG